MGILTALGLATAGAQIKAAEYSPDDTPSVITSTAEGALTSAGRVPRSTALTVPAVKRAVDLISSTIASAPLVEITGNTRKPAGTFLTQPDKSCTRALVFSKTVKDMAFDGVSYWLITSRFKEDGRPATIKHVKHDNITIKTDSNNDVVGARIGGKPVSLEQLIGFEALNGGILQAGYRAILTSVALERAVHRFANTPMPSLSVKNNGGRLNQDDIDELLNWYETALANKSVLYEGRDVDLKSHGWNPEQLGLNSARAAQAVEIARLTGVPAWYLYADPGSSMTYSNNTQARLDLHSLAISPYVTAIEQRLSMPDITPGGMGATGTRVEFDFSEFLRADPELRARLYNTLIPLGVMTAEQAAALEPLVP